MYSCVTKCVVTNSVILFTRGLDCCEEYWREDIYICVYLYIYKYVYLCVTNSISTTLAVTNSVILSFRENQSETLMRGVYEVCICVSRTQLYAIEFVTHIYTPQNQSETLMRGLRCCAESEVCMCVTNSIEFVTHIYTPQNQSETLMRGLRCCAESEVCICVSRTQLYTCVTNSIV